MKVRNYLLDMECSLCNIESPVVFEQNTGAPTSGLRYECLGCCQVPSVEEYLCMQTFFDWVIRYKNYKASDLVHSNPYIRAEAKERYERAQKKVCAK